MLDLTGQTFERLIVTRFKERVNRGPGRGTYWYCDCSCGTRDYVTTSQSLRKGSKGGARSCGCISRELSAVRIGQQSRTHGETKLEDGKQTETPEYRAWKSIKTRCHNQRYKQFKDYGGRGIKVCSRWRESFTAFLQDMGRKPSPAHSIERRDTDGDYEPGNCYWATDEEQRRNKRTTVLITIEGVTRVRCDWLRLLGVSRSTYTWRRKQGWTEVESLLGRTR